MILTHKIKILLIIKIKIRVFITLIENDSTNKTLIFKKNTIYILSMEIKDSINFL